MSSPLPEDPYTALGVPKDATTQAIKTAHRKLVLKCHPDKVPDKQDEFQRVQRAYELLSDDRRRAEYDNRVKLVALKREAMERGFSGSSPTTVYPTTRSGNTTSKFEYRSGQLYEERVPKFFEDEQMYEEPRASARKFDGYEKKPAREPEKKPKVSEKERAHIAKERVRESERSAHKERSTARDKERKREATMKAARAYVASESESDDNNYERRKPKRSEAAHKKDREAPRKKDSRDDRRSRDDDYADEWEEKHFKAEDYIQQSRVAADDSRRPGVARATSSADHYNVIKQAAYSSSPTPPEPTRRSSSKGGGFFGLVSSKKASTKERKSSGEDTPRKPPLPKTTSSPASIKAAMNAARAPPHPQRATTLQPGRESDRNDFPRMRRRETEPLTNMVGSRDERLPGSKLKKSETPRDDSGYSSPGTPEMHPSTSPPKSTKYIVELDEDYNRGHRTVLVDPEARESRRRRSPSPYRSRASERPSIETRGSSGSRRTPTRAATYAYVPEPTSRPSIPRQESSRSSGIRGSPQLSRGTSSRGELFREIPREIPEDQPYKEPYKVNYGRQYSKDDIKYADYGEPRRGSAGSMPKEAYPRSHHQEYHRPTTFGRTESSVH